MANAKKLLNLLNPSGKNLTIYTELDSGISINEKIFIVGGNYDNTKYTDKEHSEYNPFHPFATGYTILAIDQTTLSNPITINISYRNAYFNSGGIETSAFEPLPDDNTEEELFVNPNENI